MSENARKPSVKLEIAGNNRIATSVNITMQIGEYPTATAEHHQDNEAEKKSMDVDSDDITRVIGSRQNRIFNERAQSDFKINLEEKVAGELEFKGYLRNPRYAFSAFNVAMADDGLPEYAIMDSLDYKIYTFPTLKDTELITNIENSTSLTKYIIKLTDAMIKAGPSENSDLKISTKDKKAQHEINKKAHPLFVKLLKNSENTIGWEKLPDWLKSLGDTKCARLRTVVQAVLFSSSGNFLQCIKRLCDEFQLLYVPELDNPGKLVNRTDLFQEPEPLKLHLIAMSLSAGSGKGLFPVRYVTVQPQNIISDIEEYGNKKAEVVESKFILCPDPGSSELATSAWYTAGPQWLDYNLDNCQIKDPKSIKRGFTIKKAKSAKQKRKEKRKERSKVVEEVLYRWGMSVYAWQSLSTSVASVTIPLNFKPKLGKRYVVKNKDDKQLFSGYLVGIAHNLSSNGNGQALTTLDFSHIMAGDFELPGIKDMN